MNTFLRTLILYYFRILAYLVNVASFPFIRIKVLYSLYKYDWNILFIEIISLEHNNKVIEEVLKKINSLPFFIDILAKVKQPLVRSKTNKAINIFLYHEISNQAHSVGTLLDSLISYVELILDQGNSKIDKQKYEQNLILTCNRITSCFDNILNSYNINGNSLVALIKKIKVYLIDQLDSIQLNLELFSQTEKDVSEYSKIQETIYILIENIKNLLDNLFDFSYLQICKIQINNVLINVNMLLSEVNNLIRNSKYIVRNNIKLIVEKDKNLDFIFSDPKIIIKALNNLIRSAYTFNNDCIVKYGAILNIDECKFYLSTNKTGKIFREHVADLTLNDSDLIEMHLKSGLFNSNHFLMLSGKLGLYNSSHFLGLMNGNISIKYDEDSTSSLIFLEISPKVSSRNIKSDLLSKKILVVDNDIINQKILLLMLKNIIGEIDVANNGEEAVDKYSSHKYDLILMDIEMPIMDGIEAARKIREIEGNHITKIPIIAVSAYIYGEEKEKCLAAGMNEYLSKPFNIDFLTEKITSLLISNPDKNELTL